jgi:hypothetical protein
MTCFHGANRCLLRILNTEPLKLCAATLDKCHLTRGMGPKYVFLAERNSQVEHLG